MVIILDEQLVPASKREFQLLQKQIDSNPETAEMLTPSMKQIPQYYWIWRMVANMPLLKDASLYEALLGFHALPSITLEFSKAGNIFTGFLAYKVKGSEIIAMKMASFKNLSSKGLNPILAGDLIRFLDREIHRRTKIAWIADAPNESATRQYDRLLTSKKYVWAKEKYDEKDQWVYTITGKQK